MIDDGVPHTATRMGADVASVARGLAGFGIRTGDRIAIQAPNGYPWAIAAFAARMETMPEFVAYPVDRE